MVAPAASAAAAAKSEFSTMNLAAPPDVIGISATGSTTVGMPVSNSVITPSTTVITKPPAAPCSTSSGASGSQRNQELLRRNVPRGVHDQGIGCVQHRISVRHV